MTTFHERRVKTKKKKNIKHNGPMPIYQSSHNIATQSSHSVDRAGWQDKMASIEFWIQWRRNVHAPLYVSTVDNWTAFLCLLWFDGSLPQVWSKFNLFWANWKPTNPVTSMDVMWLCSSKPHPIVFRENLKLSLTTKRLPSSCSPYYSFPGWETIASQPPLLETNNTSHRA